MKRRHFLLSTLGTLGTGWFATSLVQQVALAGEFKVNKRKEDWLKIISKEQYGVLFQEDTERPWSSPLNDEKRKGTFVCAACSQPLFKSDSKFNSGTGWPSFFQSIAGALGTKRDFKLILPRTEYHCSNCGGHQGHVFDDGPPPTGKRYCNNGLALKFVADGEALPEVLKS
ncbi:peptide-methionine (R)-S-oxide reductase MsrB [Limnobacter humi]|uniref:peptide-methionine (R)-S-oxide reductase n=1 Tax=Limnobacter humi TaxID=1778671 RepID=A0ABT1WBR0_9BURK|nr:peptide-methionine (R)-S-oxide reductase MsrB [Limnobacter humi]MCQ8894950.1 peptide-methionine (R)-S-oxide reductase MsrB [Limnobacter humi]